MNPANQPSDQLDYEAVRKFYFDTGAQECANDPNAKGRFESAFFKTIKMVHEHGHAQREHLRQQVLQLEAELASLKGARSE